MRWSGVSVIAAGIFLAVFAFQYPLSTTFPVGGDAVRYVARAQDASTWLNTQYPAALALLSLAPFKFTWYMALAHLVTGLALGFLLLKQFGWAQASVGAAVWALATTGITHHFEDGTLGQLLSLPLMLLGLHFFLQKRFWLALLMLAITIPFHPFSTLILAATFILALPSWWRHWQPVVTLAALVVLGAILKGAELVNTPFDRIVDLAHLLETHFAIILALALVGFIVLWNKQRLNHTNATLTAFAAASLALSLTHVGGLSPLPFRFDSYLILAAAIGFAVFLPSLLKFLFKNTYLQATFAVILFVTLGASSWQANAFVYNYYESPSRYARPHPDEIESMNWIKDNLSEDSLVVSTNLNRHSEWIPIFGKVNWQGIDETDFIEQDLPAGTTHAVVFKKREPIPDWLNDQEPAFSNKSAFVYSLQ